MEKRETKTTNKRRDTHTKRMNERNGKHQKDRKKIMRGREITTDIAQRATGILVRNGRHQSLTSPTSENPSGTSSTETRDFRLNETRTP